jgi:hypothetical protein
MAAAARLFARIISRQGVASAAVAGVARRRPEAASLLGASALAAAAEPCASIKVGFLVSVLGWFAARVAFRNLVLEGA